MNMNSSSMNMSMSTRMTIEELATRPPRPRPTRVAPRPLRPVPPVRPMTAREYQTAVTRMAFQAACAVNRTRKASAAFAQPQVAEMHALLAHHMDVLCVELLNAAKWIARNEAELTMRSNEIAHLQAAAEAAAWDTDEEEEYYCYEEEEENEGEEEASIDLKEDKSGLLMPSEAEETAELGCESEAAEQEDEQDGGKDDAKIDVDVDVDEAVQDGLDGLDKAADDGEALPQGTEEEQVQVHRHEADSTEQLDFASWVSVCVSVLEEEEEEETTELAPLVCAPESESESESNSECDCELEGATTSCGEAGTAPVSAVVVLASREDLGTATETDTETDTEPEAETEPTASASTRGSPAAREEPRVSRIVAPKILPLRGVRRPLGTLARAKTKTATGAPAMTTRFGWKHPVVMEAVRAPAVVHVARFDPVAEAVCAVKKQERPTPTLVVDSARLLAPPHTTKKKVVEAAVAEATTTTSTRTKVTTKIRSKKPSTKAAAAAQPARWR